MRSFFILLISVIVLLFAPNVSVADETSHRYQEGEDLVVYANKIGPYHNPLETYAFFELPGCPPESWEHKFPSLGQALVGDEMYRTKMKIQFAQDTADMIVCKFTPTTEQAKRWTQMVEEEYWYQLYIDDLPAWATLGKNTNGMAQIFTHQTFKFGYNGDQLVIANLEASNPETINAGTEYTFKYSAKFLPSRVKFEERFRRYLDNNFFEHRIHWFSICNSFMLVIFLAGFVLVILNKALRADYAEIQREREESGGFEEWEGGWKQLHGDVFRVPAHAELLAALLGTGWHLLVFVFLVVTIAILSVVYTSPGSLLTYCVLTYVVTSVVAGYTSANYICEFCRRGAVKQPSWSRTCAYTILIYPGYMLFSGFLLNWVAIFYDSAQAIPFLGMVVMLCLWLLASAPLVVVGTMFRRRDSSREKDRHVNQIPRLIPKRPWYLSREMFIMAGGILPFVSIFIELYFVFTSFWNYKMYYVYGFLFLVLVILVLVTACISVVSNYFLLNGEDHRWPWTSFALGASIALYVFLYATYFFVAKTKMSGFFMFTFYFSYMSMLSVGLALMCGTVGYMATWMFVKKIFSTLKAE